jgi:GNAT superfamily N-acetyltransferase
VSDRPLLVVAEGAVHERILDQTHAVWSDGLSRRGYEQYNKAQLSTRWGGRHLQRLALLEGSRVLASAKRYDLRATLDGRTVTVLGIGAVFTPPELRGRGYGRQIVEAMLAAAREDGVVLALLFSEIGTAYYERLGFTAVPIAASELTVRPGRGAPAIPIRTGEERDLPFIAEIHAFRAGGYRFALEYDADWLQYAIAKRRLLCGLGSTRSRTVEFYVLEEGTRPAAWLLVHVEQGGSDGIPDRWTIESCGDRDPSGARVGAMLQALVARSPAAPAPSVRAWWPASFDPPQLAHDPKGPSSITMMVRPVQDDGRLEPPLTADTVLYWHVDAF